MHFSIAAKILGVLLTLFSSTLLIPLTIAVVADDATITGFAYAFALTLGSGLLLWLPVRARQRELRPVTHHARSAHRGTPAREPLGFVSSTATTSSGPAPPSGDDRRLTRSIAPCARAGG